MPKTAVLTADAKAAKRKAFRKHLKRYWVLYAMLVLPVAYYIVFKYVPMVGNVLAFRRYRPGKGPFGTEWTLRYFDRFLRDPMFWRALRNTLVLSIGNILINFPIPILFAILLNEVRAKKFKKFVQTVSYMPRFISTVVVIAILNEILSPSSGILNQFLGLFGVDPIYFMNEPQWFRPVYTFLYAVGGTAIALIMTSLMAYPLSKTFLWGNKFFTKMVVVTMFFSGGLIPNYLLLNSLHLVGTRAAMLMPFAINSFNLIILINFFRSIPNEIEEAALIDGLGYFGILRRIVLPLSTAAIATIGLYYAVFFWNDWFNSLIYLKSDQYPVMMFLRNIVNGTMVIGTGSGSAEKTTIAISVKSAVIITSTVPIIVIYPFLQKFFVKGLTIGGVKG